MACAGIRAVPEIGSGGSGLCRRLVGKVPYCTYVYHTESLALSWHSNDESSQIFLFPSDYPIDTYTIVRAFDVFRAHVFPRDYAILINRSRFPCIPSSRKQAVITESFALSSYSRESSALSAYSQFTKISCNYRIFALSSYS